MIYDQYIFSDANITLSFDLLDSRIHSEEIVHVECASLERHMLTPQNNPVSDFKSATSRDMEGLGHTPVNKGGEHQALGLDGLNIKLASTQTIVRCFMTLKCLQKS